MTTDANLAADCAPETDGGCAAVPGSPCVYLPPSVNAGKPRAARYGVNGAHPVRAYGAQQRAAGVSAGQAILQPQLDTATRALTATEQALDQARSDLADYMAKHPDAPVITSQKHPIPADALYVHPQAGADTNPGTEAKPRKTPLGGAYNVLLSADYSGFSWTAPADKITTLHVPDGETVVLDGKGTIKRALTASGQLDLFGPGRVANYAPSVANPAAGINCAAVYYGGTSAGSEIDGWTIEGSSQAGLALQNPLKLTDLLVQDCGYSGILGTNADGMRFGRVRVLRPNRANYVRDGQLAGIKMGRSRDLYFGPDVYVEDPNGANGLWTDVSCRNPTFARSVVKTGASGKPAYFGLLIEETEGGTVVGGEFEGQYNSISASGHIAAWENTFTGTVIGLQVHQDRPKNSGTTPGNLTQEQAPWWAVGESICNNTLTGPTALMCWADAAYKLDDSDMLAALRGNVFNGKVSLGDATGKRTNEDPTQIAADLLHAYDAARQPVPDAVAALLA